MGNQENTEGYSFVKSAFYPGKLLHARDFTRDQEYGNSKLEYINRKFHGWGIVEGLEVQVMQDGGLRLLRGSAIDPGGRILELSADRQVEMQEIENLRKETAWDFILGIRYAEKALETETALLDEEKRSQPMRIAETFALKAYGETELRKLRVGMTAKEELLTEEKPLFENESVSLALRIPRVVPADSLFKIRILVRAVRENDVHIGWRGMAKLQGAVFAQSGEAFLVLEEKQAMCSGRMEWEWEICTQENRNVPILLEISQMEITLDQRETAEIPTCQFHIETAVSYEQTVKRYLQTREEYDNQEDWVPLARLRLEEGARQGQYVFSLLKESGVRYSVTRPGEEEMLRRIARENGILDIRWRRLLKHMPYSQMPMPPVPPLPVPAPDIPVPPVSPENFITKQQLCEMLEKDRESRIQRGVAVISVPRRCKKGQVIFSDKIFHGFPEEEVLLWCGRVLEEQTYVYWKRSRRQYRILSGDGGLFPEEGGSWKISKLALLQNVEEGSFQIALTLAGRNRRNRSREVAVSWTAVKIE